MAAQRAGELPPFKLKSRSWEEKARRRRRAGARTRWSTHAASAAVPSPPPPRAAGGEPARGAAARKNASWLARTPPCACSASCGLDRSLVGLAAARPARRQADFPTLVRVSGPCSAARRPATSSPAPRRARDAPGERAVRAARGRAPPPGRKVVLCEASCRRSSRSPEQTRRAPKRRTATLGRLAGSRWASDGVVAQTPAPRLPARRRDRLGGRRGGGRACASRSRRPCWRRTPRPPPRRRRRGATFSPSAPPARWSRGGRASRAVRAGGHPPRTPRPDAKLPVRGLPERRRRRYHHGRGRPRADVHKRVGRDLPVACARWLRSQLAKVLCAPGNDDGVDDAGARRQPPSRKSKAEKQRLGGRQAGGRRSRACCPKGSATRRRGGVVPARVLAGRHPGGRAQASAGAAGRATGRAPRRDGPGVPVGAFAGAPGATRASLVARVSAGHARHTGAPPPTTT